MFCLFPLFLLPPNFISISVSSSSSFVFSFFDYLSSSPIISYEREPSFSPFSLLPALCIEDFVHTHKLSSVRVSLWSIYCWPSSHHPEVLGSLTSLEQQFFSSWLLSHHFFFFFEIPPSSVFFTSFLILALLVSLCFAQPLKNQWVQAVLKQLVTGLQLFHLYLRREGF